MSLTYKSHELRAIERQAEELRILNAKLHDQIKELAKSKKIKSLTDKTIDKTIDKAMQSFKFPNASQTLKRSE